jgi:hypothetical protein
MSSHHHRSGQCPNCRTALGANDNFCPSCGQENHDLKVPFKHLILELFESVFHFETKFFTTLKSIFTRPGQITSDFWEGKRARYMHPFRMYVFVSFLFFLVGNKVADKKADAVEKSIQQVEQNHSVRIAELEDLAGTGNPAQNQSSLKSKGLGEFVGIDLVVPIDSAARRHFISTLKQSKDADLDTLLRKKAIAPTAENRVKLRQALALIPDTTDIPTQLELGPINFYFGTLQQREEFTQHLGNYTTLQLDSMLTKMRLKPNRFNRTLLKQAAKASSNEGHFLSEIIHAFMKNLSWVMFVLMPVIALLLLAVFYRKKRYYFEHLIFSIHAHTILFILLTFTLTINYFASTDSLLLPAFLLGWVYFFISLKTVYQQSWLATVFKFFLLSFVYLIITFSFLAGAFFLGFMTF